MEEILRYVQDALRDHRLLADVRDKVGLVLSGSRAVGYHVPSSDYDLLAVCDAETYSRILKLAGRDPSLRAVHIPTDRDDVKRRFGIEVDVAVYETGRILDAIQSYNDVVIWIWSNARVLLDPEGAAVHLKGAFRGYPRETLERKLKAHFLRDFHLSVHGITYRPESQNVFSVLHALTVKIAEYCRLCCLLDGKSYPYEKWLLRACADTRVGRQLLPTFTRVIATLSQLGTDLEQSWSSVRKAIDAIDTEACDILEEAMVSWGIDQAWIEGAYHRLDDVLFGSLASEAGDSDQGELA